jgi:hypothetical protein
MAWTLTSDADEYLAAAGPFLESDPVRHTIQLTVARAISADRRQAAGSVTQPAQAPAADGPLFGWWQAAGAAHVSCAVLHTPPYSMLVTGLTDDAAKSLAAELAARDRQPAAVAGERAEAGSFAAAWSAHTGQTATRSESVRLYLLVRLTPPRPAPGGSARVAAAADRATLVDWFAAFQAEAGTMGPGDPDGQLSQGCLTLWERDGQPVSVAGVRPPAAGVVRIGPSTPRRPCAAMVTGELPRLLSARLLLITGSRWCCSPIWPIARATRCTSGSGSCRSKTGSGSPFTTQARRPETSAPSGARPGARADERQQPAGGRAGKLCWTPCVASCRAPPGPSTLVGRCLR